MRVAAVDQGTTSTRCLVIDGEGRWSVVFSRRHAQAHPNPGWVEHDGEELLSNVRAAIAAAGEVDAIAIANQGESCLAWDAMTGEALSPVIVWQDARTRDPLAALGPDAEARSRKLCGLPLDPYFSASKLAWLLRELPAVSAAHKARRLRLGTTDAFFLDRLSGVFATDVATASRTGLLDLKTLQWSEALCTLHGVPVACLPEIRSADSGFGAVGGVPIAASIVDQQAALYGHGCRKPGDVKVTFGTGAFLLGIVETPPGPDASLLPTVAWRLDGQPAVFAMEGGVYDVGSAIEWARKIGLFDDMNELAHFEGLSAASRGIVFVPALSGLAAPFWDRSAAPLFIGMDHATGRGDLVRAVLEGIAMLTALLIDEAGKIVPLSPRVSIDGGLSQSDAFARMLASACGREIIVPPMHELTAVGLAELCGLSVRARMDAPRCFAPDGSLSGADRERFAAALARSRDWRS